MVKVGVEDTLVAVLLFLSRLDGQEHASFTALGWASGDENCKFSLRQQQQQQKQLQK